MAFAKYTGIVCALLVSASVVDAQAPVTSANVFRGPSRAQFSIVPSITTLFNKVVPADHEEIEVSDDSTFDAETIVGDESHDCCGELGCDSSCCDSVCGPNGRDPWTLFPKNNCLGVTAGGWVSAGYHNRSTGLFNSHPHKFNLHQAWLYAEKETDAGPCCWDWGFRVDAMYGVDGQDTQAFGNPRADVPNSGIYDASLDHGIYGWALPQAYLEVAYDDFSVMIGHFYTIVGYEVVPAPDNFFYSHSLTMNNSEPFTHTGVLGTYKMDDGVEVYGGWTLGWDTGFEQLGDGNNFLGGLSFTFTDSVSLTYIATAGNMGDFTFPNGRGEGYTHSVVLDVALTDDINYVFQTDMVDLDTGIVDNNDEIGINQYLIYKINDCWSYGSRFEWWKSDRGFSHGGQSQPPGGSISYYEWTTGLNYKPHPNLRFRPELRHDWSPAANYDKYVFGVDMIVTF